ncbi:MAG: hypothetical protein HGA31_03050 [Candidatus Moranbacteria bacterium]|nr:hypothetical protein [Candidatus Moranbacteria bacterium]
MKKIYLFLVPLFLFVNTAIALCAINPADVRIDPPLHDNKGEVVGAFVKVTVSDSDYNLYPERMIYEARAMAKQATCERFTSRYTVWSPSFQGPPTTAMEKFSYFIQKHWPTRNPKFDPYSETRKQNVTVDLKFWVPLTEK